MNFVRRHAIGLLALFVALGGTAAAVTGSGDRKPQPTAQVAKKKKKKVRVVPGPPGPQGPKGESGTNGTNGTPGIQGPAGPSLFTSSGPTQPVSGVGAQLGLLPLSGALADPVPVAPDPGSITTGNLTVQSMPADLTLEGIVGTATTTSPLNIGGLVTVTAQLYTAGVGGSVLAPVAATLCNAAPTLTGIVPAGTQVQFSCNALSVPVSGGSTATIAISASNPFPGTTVVPLQTTIGLKGS